MGKKFYITTPIYYVNDEPHIGHAYTTLLADILSRYHRLMGDEVFFMTGTDEHGQKVYETAKKLGRQPKEHCDIVVKRFIELWEKLNIEYSHFIRTTDDYHIRFVQDVVQKIYDKGDIYKKSYEGWYCIHDERYWTQKDLIDNKCPLCNREVSWLKEENYFFRMSKYQDALIKHIENSPEFILPPMRRNEILGFLKQPLNDLCISRPKSRLPWGIEIPFDKDYVLYVWVDALFNYISGPLHVYGDNRIWPANLHLIGKDILTTHSVYWPTLLMSAGYELPKTILGHGWWLVDDTKMSKSLGNVVKPISLMDKYGIDTFRYFLAREMSLGYDANFSEEAFVNRNNFDLANDLGNLLTRTISMTNKYFDGNIPVVEESEFDDDIKERFNTLKANIAEYINSLKLNVAIEEIFNFIRLLNKYIERKKPWELAKRDTKELERVIYNLIEGIRISLIMLYPVMPSKVKEGLKAIDYQVDFKEASFDKELVFGKIKGGKVSRVILFPKYEFKVEKDSKEEEREDYIDIDYFKKIKLVVARIIEAEEVKGSDKLIRLTIDNGKKRKQIVAGIKKYYKPNELVNKQIIVVDNLKPAKLMGLVSEGMLLAATSKDSIVLLTPDSEVKPGTAIS